MQINSSRKRFVTAFTAVSLGLFCSAQVPVDSKDAAASNIDASLETGCCSTKSTSSSGAKSVYDPNEDFTYALPEDGCPPVRFHQARYLIEQNREFIEQGKALHEQIQNQILIAKTLKGEANMFLNNIPAAKPPKLAGPALQAAVRDYTRDLQVFVNHADRYKANLETFRKTIGECQRAQATYEQQRGLYKLHCDQFHVSGLSNIEPPHICGAVVATAGEASAIANMLRSDEQKLRASMAELNNSSALVNESRNMVAANLTATATESVRQREEEKLAKEFGRLREEYEMLKIQSNMLGSKNQQEAGKLIKRSVSGNVVK